MAHIHILGTSNSVLGNRGYVKALRLHHTVTNRSCGRNSLTYHIGQILENKTDIENADVLIIDHYGNDANFYRGVFGDDYAHFLDLFYKLLSTLNVHIINLMFPRQEHKYPDVRELVLAAAAKNNISTLDLSDLEFRPDHFADSVHINTQASYMLGLFMSLSIKNILGQKPHGGNLSQYPMRVIRGNKLDADLPVYSFSNSVSSFDYVALEKERPLPISPTEHAISVGYFREPDQKLMQGFVIDGQPHAVVSIHGGFYQEIISIHNGGRRTIGPILGSHEGIKVFSRNGMVTGEFATPCLVNIISYDSAKQFSGFAATREVFQVSLDGLIEAIDFQVHGGSPAIAEASNINASTVNFLRDYSVGVSDENIDLSIDLMQIAHHLRPGGQVIASKLKQLKAMKRKRT